MLQSMAGEGAGLRVEVRSPSEIDGFLPRFSARSVFHTRAWVELLTEAFGLRPLVLAAFDGNEPVALWPLLELRKGPLRVLGSPLPGWGTAYMGPLFSGVDPHAASAAMLARPEVRRASYIEARVIDPDDRLPLATFGFRLLQRFETYLLTLDPPEPVIWAACESRCRNAVRKAHKNGFVVRAETGVDWIDDFWAMSKEVFGRWQLSPPYDRRFLGLLWSHLAPARVQVLSSFLGGERAATVVLLHDDQSMYYWGGACFDRFRQLNPNNALLWEGIRLAIQLKLRSVDFISSSGTAGTFKKSFGPRAVTTARHWGRSRTTLEHVLKRIYESYLRQRIRSRASADRDPSAISASLPRAP